MMACFNSRLLLHESQKRSPTPRVSRSPRYSTTQQLATDHFRATGHSIPYQRPFLAQNRSCRPASQPGLGLRKHQSTIQYTFAIQQPRPQHLPRGLAQRIFSQPPRLSTSRLPLPHGSPRRSAKNALLYVTRTVSHSRASHHTQRLNRLSFTEFVFVQGAAALSEDSSHARSGK